MSEPFTVKPFPEIHFGKGKYTDLADIISRFGNTALILTGGSSFAETVHWQQLQQSLLSKGLSFYVEKITGEPSPGIIDTMVQKHCNGRFESITAIGGGSVLDAGKAVSAMLPGGKPVTQFLEGTGSISPDGRKVPFIAVPTTSGTGSEVTSNAVISRVGENGFKKIVTAR
jgi:alcohol dehydrogenase class IV